MASAVFYMEITLQTCKNYDKIIDACHKTVKRCTQLELQVRLQHERHGGVLF